MKHIIFALLCNPLFGIAQSNPFTCPYAASVSGMQASYTVGKIFVIPESFQAKSKVIDQAVIPERDLQIYPNPVTDLLYIKGTEITEAQDFTLFDIQGKMLRSFKSSDMPLNLSGIAPGLYMIAIDGRMTKYKIIKN